MFQTRSKRKMQPYTPACDKWFDDGVWKMKIAVPGDQDGQDPILPGFLLEPGISEADRYMIMCFESFRNDQVPVNLYVKELLSTGKNILANAPGFLSRRTGDGHFLASREAQLGGVLIGRANFIKKAAPRGMIHMYTTTEVFVESPGPDPSPDHLKGELSDFLRTPKPVEESSSTPGTRLRSVVSMPKATGFEEEENPEEPVDPGNEIVFDISTKRVVNKDKTGPEE